MYPDMILSPLIKQQFNGMIWRLEIDPLSATLFAEIRSEQDKLVSFASVNLISGNINFKDLAVDERWLTGIEAACNGVLLLHNYQSPGGPAHKGLIAMDGETGHMLWNDYNRTFDHMTINGPAVFDARIQPRKLFTINIKTGATLHVYQPSIDTAIDSRIITPELINADALNFSELPELPFGNIIHNLYYNHYRIVSLHALKSNKLNQSLYIFKNDRLVFDDLLNTGIQKLQPEAFILHNHHLIYLKNKTELNVINLKN